MKHNISAFIATQIEIFTGFLERFHTVWSWIAMAAITIFTFVMHQIGGQSNSVVWFLQLQVADFIFGTYAGLTNRGKHNTTYRSDLGIRGIDKKVSTWLYIWAAYQLDIIFSGGDTTIRDIFIKLYAVHTIGSLLEIWVLLKWVGYAKIEKVLIGRLQDVESWLINMVPNFIFRRNNKNDDKKDKEE